MFWNNMVEHHRVFLDQEIMKVIFVESCKRQTYIVDVFR